MSVAVADAGGMDFGCCCTVANVHVRAEKTWWFFYDFNAHFANDFSTATTRYRTATLTNHFHIGGGVYKDAVVVLTFDRLNGKPSLTLNSDAATYGWQSPLKSRPWSVASGTSMSWATATENMTLSLSDPYPLADLNADVDDMFAAIDPVDVGSFEGFDWSLVLLAYNDYTGPFWDATLFFPGPIEAAAMKQGHPAPAISVTTSGSFFIGEAFCQHDRKLAFGSKMRNFWRGLGGAHCTGTVWTPEGIVPSQCATLPADADGNVLVIPPAFPSAAGDASGFVLGEMQLTQNAQASPGGTCPCIPT